MARRFVTVDVDGKRYTAGNVSKAQFRILRAAVQSGNRTNAQRVARLMGMCERSTELEIVDVLNTAIYAGDDDE